jgi:hypothetical protein
MSKAQRSSLPAAADQLVEDAAVTATRRSGDMKAAGAQFFR